MYDRMSHVCVARLGGVCYEYSLGWGYGNFNSMVVDIGLVLFSTRPGVPRAWTEGPVSVGRGYNLHRSDTRSPRLL